MKPPSVVRKTTSVFHQSGAMEVGKGRITGVIALTLSGLAVPAFHFAAFLDQILGTAVKSDRRFPSKYDVLGDYMPPGFVRQQLFPFVRKG